MDTGFFPEVKSLKGSVDHPPHLPPRLTLILLTSTKWWAPASGSKWQMGFNSTFKGLKKEYGYTSAPPLGLRGLF
jgi:hypothetical protein